MATPHGWTSHGQERGAMVLKPGGPQARAIKLEKQNKALNKQLADQQQALDGLVGMLKDKGILTDEE